MKTTLASTALARLGRERGIGPWSVGVIALQGLGRYDAGLVSDLSLVKLFASLRGRWPERPDETAELLAPYGEWQGLASVFLLAGFSRGLVPGRERRSRAARPDHPLRRVTDIAPDGSPVLLYSRLPALGEPELIHEAVPAGAEILELGAGAGRITHELLALGHEVVAVDNSSAMLAFIRGAETILADLETLDLGRRFPVVVLASNFINDPDGSDSPRVSRGAAPDTFSRTARCCFRGFLATGSRTPTGPSTETFGSGSNASRKTATSCPARWSTWSTESSSTMSSSRSC